MYASSVSTAARASRPGIRSQNRRQVATPYSRNFRRAGGRVRRISARTIRIASALSAQPLGIIGTPLKR
jgi:hypothetical protein